MITKDKKNVPEDETKGEPAFSTDNIKMGADEAFKTVESDIVRKLTAADNEQKRKK